MKKWTYYEGWPLLRGTVVVFYYLISSEIWSDNRGGLIRGWPPLKVTK